MDTSQNGHKPNLSQVEPTVPACDRFCVGYILGLAVSICGRFDPTFVEARDVGRPLATTPHQIVTHVTVNIDLKNQVISQPSSNPPVSLYVGK